MFLLGGSKEVRKINWVKWDKVFENKDIGGWWVRKIRVFFFRGWGITRGMKSKEKDNYRLTTRGGEIPS